PFVDALADRVVAECGLDDADVFALRDEIRVLSGRLRTHLYEEEAVLFPALRAQPIDRAALARELARMDEEHALVRAQIAKVRALAERCGVAAESDTTRGRLLREIGALEYDTLQHIDVETNVLLRRVA